MRVWTLKFFFSLCVCVYRIAGDWWGFSSSRHIRATLCSTNQNQKKKQATFFSFVYSFRVDAMLSVPITPKHFAVINAWISYRKIGEGDNMKGGKKHTHRRWISDVSVNRIDGTNFLFLLSPLFFFVVISIQILYRRTILYIKIFVKRFFFYLLLSGAHSSEPKRGKNKNEKKKNGMKEGKRQWGGGLSNVEWIPMERINITPASSFSLCLDYYYQKGEKKTKKTSELFAIQNSRTATTRRYRVKHSSYKKKTGERVG